MSNPHEITLAEAATQPGCLAVRSYFSLDSTNALTLVLVSVNSNNHDLTNGKIMDKGTKCPIICDMNSPLL